jgi:glycine/D-amino acid oxidase-like deaminating enzyme
MVANGQPVVHLQAPLSLTDGLEAHQNPVWAADLANPKLSYYGFPPTNGIIKVAQHGAGYQSSRSNFAPKTIVSNPSTGSLVPLEFVKNVRGFFDQYFPQLANLDIVNTRICWYCDSFDGDFFIAKLPDHPQLLIAAGGSGHAFKFMPVLGNVIVDAFEGRKTKYTDRFKWRTKNDAIEKQESSRSTNSGQKDLDEIQLASSQDLLSRSKF